jgi:N-acetylglutamate synthase-like GNAT family acetyltransferase
VRGGIVNGPGRGGGAAASGSAAIRAATPNDWQAIAELLSMAALPLDGAAEHFHEFVVAERGGVVVGCAGVEHYADVGLLRSVAVVPSERGLGTGASLVSRCISDARAAGLDALVLLTTTAERYFPRFGFDVIDRADVPDAVRASAEFRGACPASAVAMRLVVSEPSLDASTIVDV